MNFPAAQARYKEKYAHLEDDDVPKWSPDTPKNDPGSWSTHWYNILKHSIPAETFSRHAEPILTQLGLDVVGYAIQEAVRVNPMYAVDFLVSFATLVRPHQFVFLDYVNKKNLNSDELMKTVSDIFMAPTSILDTSEAETAQPAQPEISSRPQLPAKRAARDAEKAETARIEAAQKAESARIEAAEKAVKISAETKRLAEKYNQKIPKEMAGSPMEKAILEHHHRMAQNAVAAETAKAFAAAHLRELRKKSQRSRQSSE